MVERKRVEERLADYENIRATALKLYNTFPDIASHALGKQISFTSEGFNHLVYSSPRKERDKKSQILRFDMLKKAKFILETSTTYQEYDEEIISKRVNRRGKWISKNVSSKSWGFVAIVQNFRVKVVVTQEGNGSIKFLSVAPAWFAKQYRDMKIIKMSTGGGLKVLDDDEVLKNATIM